VALIQAKLPLYNYNNKQLKELLDLGKDIFVTFSGVNKPIEVVPQTKPNLPLVLTRRVAI